MKRRKSDPRFLFYCWLRQQNKGVTFPMKNKRKKTKNQIRKVNLAFSFQGFCSRRMLFWIYKFPIIEPVSPSLELLWVMLSQSFLNIICWSGIETSFFWLDDVNIEHNAPLIIPKMQKPLNEKLQRLLFCSGGRIWTCGPAVSGIMIQRTWIQLT